jgi:hypothetical protein
MPHVAGGKFPASAIRSSAFAVAPGARVTSSRGGVGFSLAERPIWPPDAPVDANETPRSPAQLMSSAIAMYWQVAAAHTKTWKTSW